MRAQTIRSVVADQLDVYALAAEEGAGWPGIRQNSTRRPCSGLTEHWFE